MTQTLLPLLAQAIRRPVAGVGAFRAKSRDARLFAATIIMGFDETKFLNGLTSLASFDSNDGEPIHPDILKKSATVAQVNLDGRIMMLATILDWARCRTGG